MLVVRSLEEAAHIEVSEIQTLVRRRIAALSEDEPYDPETMANFVVLQPGDTTAAVNERLGFDILTNRVTGIRFDEAGFHCSFEVLEEHGSCYEILFILCDDGYGIDVFVPKLDGLPTDLLAMCACYAVPSQESADS